MSRRIVSLGLGLVLLFACLGAQRPNILWVSCEDIGPHLKCYGFQHAITPNLDQLASEGIRYERAFTVTGVCATCRASIITGMYPSTLGNQFMRCSVDLPSHVKLFPQYFRDAGYYCTNNSKTDYNVTGPHGRCWDESSRQAHWRNRPQADQPFFAVFNFTNTHESSVFNYKRPANLSDAEIHESDDMSPPPFHPNTEITRLDWAHYYDNITSMDKRVGQVLKELADDGLAEDTIVVFWGDHGAGLPRSKRWIYESGTHVPLIVRIPKTFRADGEGGPGTVTRELVSLLDLAPTMMNLAGIDPPEYFHGQAFLGPERAPPRRYIYTIRDRMDERYDTIRAVRNDRYKYIRNHQPYRPYFQTINYMEQEHTMQELRRLHQAGELSPEAEQFMVDSKPVEELYDLQQDPHEVNNLMDQVDRRPELQAALDELRGQLHEWRIATRDTGLIPEAELAAREKVFGTRFAILQGDDAPALIERLVRVNAWACQPDQVQDKLIDASRDQDAAVRYWALIGLGNLHAPSDEAQQVVRRALADTSGSVRVAAARAAWRSGDVEAALPVIAEAAKSGQEFLSLEAIDLIDQMNEDARPIWDTVEWVKENQSGYPARVAEYLLDNPL